jgi:hypothetical protein
MVRMVVVLAAMFCLLQLLLLLVAIGVGFLLHWLIPDLGIGHAILVGTISAIATGYFFAQVAQSGITTAMNEDDSTDQDEEEEDEEDDAVPKPHRDWTPPAMRRRQRRKR